jgi:hypothetical protein
MSKFDKQVDEIKGRVSEEIEEKKSWLRGKWWLGWAILGFFVACGILWGVTR